MARPAKLDRLNPTIQVSAWGDTEAIAVLQRRDPSGEPEAELWMGAHPKASSTLSDGVTLLEAIEADREGWLGPSASNFESLPYLFKVLAAARPLSIQAHPSLDQAIAGFVREDAEGIPVGADNRTYRDSNHKPEMVCALTPFEALCGFRSEADITAILAALDDPRFDPLRARLLVDSSEQSWSERLASTVAWLLGGADPAVEYLIAAVTLPSEHSGLAGEALSVAKKAAAHYPGDPGLVVSLLLNYLRLEPGQAVFLEAGNLHAYLEGTAIELMANSDNVIRGGFTPKYIDVPELLRVVSFESIDPPVQEAAASGWHTFQTPVPEFALSRVTLSTSEQPGGIERSAGERRGPEIMIVVDGSVQILADDGDELLVNQGQVVAVPFGSGGYVVTGNGTLFVAEPGTVANSR